MKLNFETYSAYFGDGVAQSQMDIIIVTSDCLPSPDQTTPPSQSDVVEHAHMFIQLSYPPNINYINFHVALVAKPMGCHVHFLPQPPSSCFGDPTDCTVLCSPILNSTLVVNEDQAIDEVGFTQPTCVVIHDEYDWEPEHQLAAKDDLLLSVPPPLFLTSLVIPPSLLFLV